MTTVHSASALATCVSCVANLDHCHGTAIVHAHGRVECTDDPTCQSVEEAHAYVILCFELDGECC